MKSKLTFLILGSVLALVLGGSWAVAQETATVQLIAIDDAYISVAHQSTNYGSSINTYVGDRHTAQFDSTCTSFYQFDMSEVPYNAEIVNAELWLYKHEKFGAFQQNLTVDAHLITTPGWNENTITYNAPPGYSTSASASVTEWFTAPGWVTWNVTADVAAMRPSQNLIGWKMEMTPAVPYVWLNFYSSEQVPMPDYRPMLEITYISVVANEAASWSEVKSLYR